MDLDDAESRYGMYTYLKKTDFHNLLFLRSHEETRIKELQQKLIDAIDKLIKNRTFLEDVENSLILESNDAKNELVSYVRVVIP